VALSELIHCACSTNWRPPLRLNMTNSATERAKGMKVKIAAVSLTPRDCLANRAKRIAPTVGRNSIIERG